MISDYIEFETRFGPAYVVYRAPDQWEKGRPSVGQVLVQCPDNIVWDNSTNKWWPEPQVVDEVLPKARAICQLLGVPPYEWLREVRRSDVWAIEREFTQDTPVSMMMDFYHNDDYDGIHRHKKGLVYNGR